MNKMWMRFLFHWVHGLADDWRMRCCGKLRRLKRELDLENMRKN